MILRLGAAILAALPLTGAAAAAPLDGLAGAPPGAASCSGCHARAAASGTAVPPIHGRPAGELAAALAAFRSGERPATVMNRIVTGFSAAESEVIAEWLSRQR
jgi:cytochrome subunit of sulfide dehydrogenase